MKILAAIACVVAMAFSGACDAKGGGGHNSGASHASWHHSGHSSKNSHGKIARSVKAKDDFKHSHPCPSTGRKSGACPGYVIDHVQPLKRGGADAPGNMQWQTTAAARAKDRAE